MVQEDSKDEALREELYHLVVLINQTLSRSQKPLTIQARRRTPSSLYKDYLPAPDAQWPIEASVILGEQDLFEMAIELTKSYSTSTFTYIGKAMFLFDLSTTHAQ